MSQTANTYWGQPPPPPPDPLRLSITGLFRGHIVASAEREGFYDYPFGLSTTPDPRWAKAFIRAYAVSDLPQRREVHLDGSRLVACVHPDDDKQRLFDAIKRAVEQANTRCHDLRASKLSEVTKREGALRRDAALLHRLQAEAEEIVIDVPAERDPAPPAPRNVESVGPPDRLQEMGVRRLVRHAMPRHAGRNWG